MKIGISTICDNGNVGNRLQAYAMYYFLSNNNYECEQIRNNSIDEYTFKNKVKKDIKICLYKIFKLSKWTREDHFRLFNKNIRFSKYFINKNGDNERLNQKFTHFIVGSDQVWNPEFAGFDFYFLDYVTDPKKKIAYAASIGTTDLSDEYKEKMKKYLKDFKSISVREDEANKLLTDLLHRNDIKTVIDPTMLLTSQEWERLEKRPKALDSDRYILLYFLGNLSDRRYNQIKEVAENESCKIVNILDEQSPLYSCGPAEFLYLEHHAKYVFTDSFHSSVFSVLFYTPFVIYNREDKELSSMNSRIDTLINTLKLENRWYNEKEITKENLEADYTEAYKILDLKRKESLEFLKRALSD